MLTLARRYLRRIDAVYLALCLLCSAFSVVGLFSVGYSQLGGSANKASVQFIASLLGAMLAVIVSTVDYRALARAWPLHAVVAWGLVLPTLFLRNLQAGFVVIGYDAGGTSNYSWYRIGGMTFQPAELAKLSFILTLAWHLDRVRGRVNRPLNLLALGAHILLPVLAGGLSIPLALAGLGAAAAGGAAVLLTHPGLLKGYQFRRILAVLTPEDPDLADIAYQQNKAAMAIGTGGLTGQGLFQQESIFIPNAWNDFIFSYLANALGFVGALAVLGLLGALLLRTLRTAAASVDLLGRLIATGVFGALFLQCVINIGMNLQVLPVIGVTLPFFSAGGSSVLMVYLSVGLVLSIGLTSRRSAGLAAPIE